MHFYKFQHERKNPHKPTVVKGAHIWWAQVIDHHDTLQVEIGYSQPDALAKAYELAALVESQRTTTEPTA